MKTIRLIIVLALFVCSLALDMSSAKSRVESSAYVSLYSELGMTEGFKTMLTQPPEGGAQSCDGPQDAKFFINVKGANGKESDIGNNIDTKVSTSFVDELSSAIFFPSSDTWNAKFPKWLKDQCTATTCTLTNALKISQQVDKDSRFYFEVNMKSGNTLKIVITNGGYGDSCGTYSAQKMATVITEFKSSQKIFSQRFWEKSQQVVSALTSLLDDLTRLKAKNEYRANMIKGNIAKNEKTIDTCLKKKKDLNKAIAALNASIDEKKTKVSNTSASKLKCVNEYINLNLAIMNEITRIANKKASIAKALAKAKANKAKYLKSLFYWIEASFYYRIFAEKLVKDTQALDAATLAPANLKTTQAKITRAFHPVPVYFADDAAK